MDIFPGIDLLIRKERPYRFSLAPYSQCRRCEKGGKVAVVTGFEICTRDPLAPATPDAMEKVGLSACFFVNGKCFAAFHTNHLPGNYHRVDSPCIFLSWLILRYAEQVKVPPRHKPRAELHSSSEPSGISGTTLLLVHTLSSLCNPPGFTLFCVADRCSYS